MKKSILLCVTLLVCAVSYGQSLVYEAADSSPAIRVYNGDSSDTLTITVSSGGAAADMTAVIGTTTNTLDGSGNDDTVAELAALIGACTNSSGAKVLITDTDCALGADSTDGELLDGTYTAVAGAWLEIPWDTSDVNFYSVYVPDQQVKNSNRSKLDVTGINGSVLGTGPLTLNLYIGGSVAWSAHFPTNAYGVVESPLLDVDIPAGRNAILLRGSRTTATTGGLGITVE